MHSTNVGRYGPTRRQIRFTTYVQAGAGVPPFWRDEGARLKHGREQRQALRRPSRLNEKVADAGSRDAGAESSKGPGLY